MATNYVNVNAAWPIDCPKPTPQEALRGTKLLVRFIRQHAGEETGRKPGRRDPYKYKLTSGHRYTWCRHFIWKVNPNGPHFGGWKDIVHCVSHWAQRKYWPTEKPHGPRHAFMEKMLAEHVVQSGWLDGKLKRPDKPKAKIDIKRVRYERTLKKIKSWESKAKRAKNALRKLAAQRKYYEHVLTLDHGESTMH